MTETAAPSMQQVLLALEQAARARLEDGGRRRLVVDPDPGEIRDHLRAGYHFARPIASDALIADVLAMLERWDLDSTHPRYFGLFNPPALPVTAAADALVAMWNPQVGTRTHAPAANEIEAHVLAFLTERIGFSAASAGAHFTSGGQEANTTAMAAALTRHCPAVMADGVRALPGAPRLYASEHAHHSLVKAARLLGLGENAVRPVPAHGLGGMQVPALRARIAADRAAGDLPFLVVATAGATGTGAIDPLGDLATAASAESLWLHVDAAWGGGALLSDRLRPFLAGIERADSVTWDAHKWLDVPMGAGMVFFRDGAAAGEVFRVATGYVPASSQSAIEPYQQTFQWSRRFIGLKLFMALASLSAPGYARLIERQADLGHSLREKLRAAGWRVLNDTPLPLVCFADAARTTVAGRELERFVDRVRARGRVWVSSVTLPGGEEAVRACITSYETREEDLDVLIAELGSCRTPAEAPG